MSNDETLTRRFEVELEDLVAMNGIEDLNDRLDSELENEPHVATDIAYKVVGFVAGEGEGWLGGTLTIEATYVPDLFREGEEA